MECPVCHDFISAHEEAFIEGCWHRFCFQCIWSWSRAQLTDQTSGASSACPMCRHQYEAIYHEFTGSSIRRLKLDGSAVERPLSDLRWPAAHRRRGALYIQSNSAQEGTYTQPTLPTRVPSPQQLTDFLQRELQVLSGDDNVTLLEQVALPIINAVLQPLKQLPAGRKQQAEPAWQALPSRLASAMVPFFPQQAQQLAQELVSFIAAGLSVAAYDQAVFGQKPAARAPGTAAPGQQQSDTPDGQQQQQQQQGTQQGAVGQEEEYGGYGSDVDNSGGAAVGSWAAQAAELTGSWREA